MQHPPPRNQTHIDPGQTYLQTKKEDPPPAEISFEPQWPEGEEEKGKPHVYLVSQEDIAQRG